MSVETWENFENSTLSSVAYYLDGYWADYGDPRTESFTLMATGRPIIYLMMGIYLIVYYLGTRIMSYREKSIRLPTLHFLYNVTMLLINSTLLLKLVPYLGTFLSLPFSLTFATPPQSGVPVTEEESYIMGTFHLYLFAKLLDLVSEFYLVLQKAPLTPVHIYHHLSAPIFVWINFRLNPLGPLLVPFFIFNSIASWAKYADLSLGYIDPVPGKLWKRYLPILGMIAVALMIVQGSVFLLFQVGASKAYLYTLGTHLILYVLLHFLSGKGNTGKKTKKVQ